jgi:CRP-like cAMP-binding protein
VGNEGMVGYTALLGVHTSLHQVACQVAGECLRIPISVLSEAVARRKAIDNLVKRYMAVAYRTAIQAVFCNALHPVEQRVCRWLLSTQEKATGEVLATQEILAALLGVKRPTVSLVANALQKAGIIRYHRGTVRILDQAGLEQSACACYQITKTIYDEILKR